MISSAEYLATVREYIDRELDRLLPTVTTAPARLHEAIRYSVFTGGKRLRPALCIASCESLGGVRGAALIPAVALEVLHTYTLIHDDLPALDNDDMRRGKLACHKAFDEATAILAGDALLTYAFQLLADTGNTRLVHELAIATGSLGTIGGQVDDMQAKHKALTQQDILSIHERKTGMLFSVSCRLGGIATNATDADIDILGQWGKSLGVAFQLLDDVCDNDPVTMQIFSREGAIQKAKEYEISAQELLDKLSGDTSILQGIAQILTASFSL